MKSKQHLCYHVCIFITVVPWVHLPINTWECLTSDWKAVCLPPLPSLHILVTSSPRVVLHHHFPMSTPPTSQSIINTWECLPSECLPSDWATVSFTILTLPTSFWLPTLCHHVLVVLHHHFLMSTPPHQPLMLGSTYQPGSVVYYTLFPETHTKLYIYITYLVSPCPSCPPSPLPHEYTSPSAVNAR